MTKKSELEILSKKYQKLKKFNICLVFIILIGLLCAGFLVFLFFHKDVAKNNTLVQKVVMFRKKIQTNEIYGQEYFENYHNASYVLDLYDGGEDLHATHPKIIFFDKKWHGYKYWMVYSPYPHFNDELENPYLVVSNDLINWKTPEGLENPIEPAPDNYEHEKVYNSDPHILYNPDTDKIELYFRFVDDIHDKVIIYRMESKDGVHWSEKEAILTNARSKVDYLSPAVLYDEGTYKMWYVGKDRNVYYIESEDGYHYSKPEKKELNFPIPEIQSWHLDAIKTEHGYELLVSGYRNHKDRSSMNLYHFVSEDNKKYEKGTVVLRPSVSSWDNKGLYRSSFMYEDGVYYVFYSGISMNDDRGIGLSYGPDINNLVGSSVKKKNN